MNNKQSKPWYKRFFIWLIIIIVLIIAGNAIGGQSNTNPTSTTNGDETSSQQGQKAEEKTEFAVGETATFSNKSITVTDVQRNYDTGNQFAQPESGKEFVIVTVSIANDSDSTLTFNPYEFKMQDSNGVQLNESFTALSEGKLNSGSLAKSGKVTGKLAYEVPAGDAGLKLLYQNFSFFDNKAITFKL